MGYRAFQDNQLLKDVVTSGDLRRFNDDIQGSFLVGQSGLN
jgi:hypothetical protein